MKMERFDNTPDFVLSDYEDESFYNLLRQLPTPLAARHVAYIENNDLSDKEAENYLQEIIAGRQEVTTSSEISDAGLAQILENNPELREQIFKSLETTVFNNPDNYLGAGMTAKVKKYEIQTHDNDEETKIPLAVKYVVTPTAKTLSAEQEHNVIKEVERMRTIENAEMQHPRRSRYLRVPHPYLHHSNDKLQLYGMEHIDGIDIYQATNGGLTSELKEKLRESRLAEVTPEEMDGYIERFFNTMHDHCLHGDIKPANIMVNSEGVLYVIDFGQSISPHNIPKGAEEQFETLKSDEIKEAKLCVRRLLQTVFREE